MNPNLVYWTGTFLNMLLIVALAWRGVRSIRRGDVRAHRRSMSLAGALVGVFLVSYLAKLAALGHEDRSLWTRADLAVLYLHESCVAAMLLGGAGAGVQAFRVRRTRRVTGDPADPAPAAATLGWHRRLGWTALAGAALGLASAALVLLGMYRRAGLL